MPNSLIFTDQAHEDLEALLIHIALKDGKERALKIHDKIERALDRLLLFPDSGAIPRVSEIAQKGYRFIIQDNMLFFYRCRNDCIYIAAVLHGAQDYTRKKFD